MLELIRNNISWIKDLFILVFTAIATAVTVLTYKRAKDTILQPIRNETIRKQSEILSQLLDFFQPNDHEFESAIDYVNIVQVNIVLQLKEYGFLFKDNDKLFDTVQQKISGFIPCKDTKILHDIEVIQPFETKENKHSWIDISKQKYEQLKKGIVEIDRIYITNKYSTFISKLLGFTHNVFLPKKIISILYNYISSIDENLTVILKKELENFLKEYEELYFNKSDDIPNFNPLGVYNSFNHAKIHYNKNTIAKLRNEIREYLLIDKPWK